MEMEIKEYQENGMNIREIWMDGVRKGREESPILIDIPLTNKNVI